MTRGTAFIPAAVLAIAMTASTQVPAQSLLVQALIVGAAKGLAIGLVDAAIQANAAPVVAYETPRAVAYAPTAVYRSTGAYQGLSQMALPPGVFYNTPCSSFDAVTMRTIPCGAAAPVVQQVAIASDGCCETESAYRPAPLIHLGRHGVVRSRAHVGRAHAIRSHSRQAIAFRAGGLRR